MATYNTDLSVFDLADNNSNWAELNGHTSGSAPAADTENYFHNSVSVSQGTGQATGTNAGMQCDYGSAITWTTGWVIMVWQYYTAPTNINTWANGGMRIGVGSTTGNMDYWNAVGSDLGTGKECWQNTAIDPSDPTGATYSWLAADGTADGSPTGAVRLVGSLPNVLAKITKGSPHACDVIRYGRGEIYGTGTGGTFAGYAGFNDVTSSLGRVGLFERTRGGYLWKGLFSFGQSGTSLTFSDTDVSIFLDDTPRVRPDFNKMQILNASTSVTWTGVNITGVRTSITGSAPNAPGEFDFSVGTTDINGGTFTDLGVWTFNSSSTIDDATYRRVKSIAGSGGQFTNVTFDAANDTEAVVVADLDEVDGCDFTVDGTNGGHAVELTGAASSYDWNCTTSGYDTGSVGDGVEVTGGSITGDEDIHITATTGTFTISVASGATTPSVSSAGAAVNVVAGARTVKIVAQTDTGTKIQSARAFLAVSETGGLPYQAAITTIARSTTTATVTFTAAHGLKVSDKFLIAGITDKTEDNATQTVVSVTSTTVVTYTTTDSGSTAYTGTKTGTFVFLKGLTDVNGEISMTRSFGATQGATGWARKSSSAPYYKQGAVSGDVSHSGDTTFTATLISDD